MRKVCFFSGDISRSGGTERVTTVIASELVQRGYEVTILSLARGTASYFPLHPDVKLYSLGMERHRANLNDIRIWYRLRRLLQQQAIDVLIDVDIILSWYSIPAAWGTATSVIAWEHFHLLINVGDRFQCWRRSMARRMAVRFAMAVVTLTEKDLQQYLKHLPCKTQLLAIPNPTTMAHAQRAKLDTKVVLAAGRLVQQKGFDLLLQAWSLVTPHVEGWRLIIVGSGVDERMLKVLTEKLSLTASVEFTSHAADMASHYQEASIFALSSRYEGFGLVLLEAKSFGLPVVSFDCDCGPSDIIRDGYDGLLVPPGDVEHFAQSLRLLIEDDGKRHSMGERGYEDRRFELPIVVDIWQDLIG